MYYFQHKTKTSYFELMIDEYVDYLGIYRSDHSDSNHVDAKEYISKGKGMYNQQYKIVKVTVEYVK